MNTRTDPKQLAIDLLSRSVCQVKVSAVAWDGHGIFSWGYNHAGPDGFGEHAEINLIKRSNRNRLINCSVAIAAIRARNNKIITAFPCENCLLRLIKVGIKIVWVQSKSGVWQKVNL